MPAVIKVIGVGNAFRGDDAAGLETIARLETLHIDGIDLCCQSGEGTSLMMAWQDVPAIIIIDAVSSQSQPGTIFKFEAHQEKIPTKFFHYSTHNFSVAEAVELARTLDQLPDKLIIYGIEGANFAAGAGLTIEVDKAIDQLIDRLLADIIKLKAELLN